MINIIECDDYEAAKNLILDYSTIRGAEACFVSLDKEVRFTTKPEVMSIGYALYKKIGFEELENNEGTVLMRMILDTLN